jgi:hypothetical protein
MSKYLSLLVSKLEWVETYMWIGSIARSELTCSSAGEAALSVAGWARETSCAGTENSGLTGVDGGRRDEEYELELLHS